MGSTVLRLKETLCVIYSGLLFLLGIVLIVYSVIYLYKIFYHFTFVPAGIIGPFIVLFLLGIIQLLLPWLGLKGPTREHNFHIFMFMGFTIVLLICELTVGIWSIILWTNAEVKSTNLMNESFSEFLKLGQDKNAWSKVQSQFQCCGINGRKDYVNTDLYSVACFKNQDSASLVFNLDNNGCKMYVIKYVKSILFKGALFGFLCTIFQAIGLFMFYTFFATLREERVKRLTRLQDAERQLVSSGHPGQDPNVTQSSQNQQYSAQHQPSSPSQRTASSAPNSPGVVT